MDIAEKRNLSSDLIPFVKQISFNQDTKKVRLLGSAGLLSQQNYSDIDLFEDLSHISIDCKSIYLRLKHVMEDVYPNLYFIEYKLQSRDGKKIRTLGGLKRFCEAFKTVDFIKLDFIVWLQDEFKFVEMSIIYNFNKEFDKREYKKKIIDEMRELYKEGNYFKVLKRMFSLLLKQRRSIKRDNLLLVLSEFFNSRYGEMYQDVSNLKAIDKIIKFYRDFDIERKININLKSINRKLSDTNRLEKEYNSEAKKILDNIEKNK